VDKGGKVGRGGGGGRREGRVRPTRDIYGQERKRIEGGGEKGAGGRVEYRRGRGTAAATQGSGLAQGCPSAAPDVRWRRRRRRAAARCPPRRPRCSLACAWAAAAAAGGGRWDSGGRNSCAAAWNRAPRRQESRPAREGGKGREGGREGMGGEGGEKRGWGVAESAAHVTTLDACTALGGRAGRRGHDSGRADMGPAAAARPSRIASQSSRTLEIVCAARLRRGQLQVVNAA
jgi:hypothetical protein